MTLRRGRLALAGLALAALAAGVLLALSLPPWGWWPLAPLGYAVLYRRLAGLPVRSRLFAGYVTGLGVFGVGLFWMSEFTLPGAILAALIHSVFVAGGGALTPPERWRLPSFVGAMVLGEAVRVRWPFGGVPLGGVPLGQIGGPAGPARLGGGLALLAIAALAGAALAELATLFRSGQPKAPKTRRFAGQNAVGALLAGRRARRRGTRGARRQRHRDAAHGDRAGGRAPRLHLAADRGGGVVPGPGGCEHEGARAARPGAVARGRDPRAARRGRDARGRRPGRPGRGVHATVVAGVVEEIPGGFHNAAVAWSPDGRIVDQYEKVRRVPFGEYVPLRGLVKHLADLSAVPDDAIPGHGPGLLRTPAGNLGVLISYEVFFASRGRAAGGAGAGVVAGAARRRLFLPPPAPPRGGGGPRVGGGRPGAGGRRRRPQLLRRGSIPRRAPPRPPPGERTVI